MAGPPTATAVDPLHGRRVLLAVTGSIAAVKAPALVTGLQARGAEVRCLLSPSAERLVSPVALACLSRHPCACERDQWQPGQPRPLHIDLAEWPDLVLLAPLSAATLARLVHGHADQLLASTLLARPATCPLVAAAAMNTDMWLAPAVQRNWALLDEEPGVLALPPAASGLLACDRLGPGRMVEPALLELAAASVLERGVGRDLVGRSLVVTAGPTREAIDPARFLSNPSSGRMGVLLAQAARLRGARVVLIHGPLQVNPAWLEGLECQAIVSASDLEQALARRTPGADAVLMAAAVADQRWRHPDPAKAPKHVLQQNLADAANWEEVPDLLQQLVARRPPGQVLLGFAAHTGDVLSQARAKLACKGCDLLFANPIDADGAGFGSETNVGWLLDARGPVREIGPCTKLALAHRLLDAVADHWDQLPGASGSVATEGLGSSSSSMNVLS